MKLGHMTCESCKRVHFGVIFIVWFYQLLVLYICLNYYDITNFHVQILMNLSMPKQNDKS